MKSKIYGSFSLQAQERVIDAISRAGGIRQTTDFGYQASGAGNRAMIIRTLNPDTAQEKRIVVNIDLQALLQSGDQISNIVMVDKDVMFIPAADLFYIIGQVKKTGSYPLPENELTLVEAISMAGGFTPIAARNRTRIIRVEDGLEKIIGVKVDAITAAGRKIQDVTIRSNDIIVVPESFF
jgi:polysaccharide export outer membrane protein